MQNVERDNAGIMAARARGPSEDPRPQLGLKIKTAASCIEEQIRVGVRCAHQDLPGFARQGKLFQETCGAEARIVRAPKGKLDALLVSLDAHGGFREDERWTRAVISIMQQQMRDNSERTRQIMASRQAQFQHDQAVRAQQNQQYQEATQAGYARHNAQQRFSRLHRPRMKYRT